MLMVASSDWPDWSDREDLYSNERATFPGASRKALCNKALAGMQANRTRAGVPCTMSAIDAVTHLMREVSSRKSGRPRPKKDPAHGRVA